MSVTTLAVRERPILFSAPMVRSILADQKTQTRRVVKAAHLRNLALGVRRARAEWGDSAFVDIAIRDVLERVLTLCPYGQHSDRLWVRETHYVWSAGYMDGTGREISYRATEPDAPTTWTPSIHMPRWASRITLELTGVRVERVQEISEADAIAEGCSRDYNDVPWCTDQACTHRGAQWHFRSIWDSLNAKRGYGWDLNPWVWVLAFRRITP